MSNLRKKYFLRQNRQTEPLFLFALLLLLTVSSFLSSGCSSVPEQKVPSLEIASGSADNLNPLYVRTEDNKWLWESIVDVVDNYFPIASESPVLKDESQNNGVLISRFTEGRLDTKPVIAPGVCQPWKKSSANISQRWEATFQTIRRYAVVRVVPENEGFKINLAVYNEMENRSNPMNSRKSNTNFTFTDDLSQLELPAGPTAPSDGWFPIGRNTEMEQIILEELAWRLNNPPYLINSQGDPKPTPSAVVP